MKGHLDVILQICIHEFSDNAYVINYKERTLDAMESTNILQKEDDENISLEEEVYEEEKEENMTHPKLRDVLELLNDDSNTQTQNSIAIYKAPYTFSAGIRNHENPSYDDEPLMASSSTSEIIDKKECCLNML
jgi:ERCC4-related helicase